MEINSREKKILIISPHFPPSNLAAVHRSRLFAMHLPAMGWKPYVLMVHEQYYEEGLDHNLEKLLPKELRIEKVGAFGLTRPRLIGDIGLRGFLQLYKRARQLILQEQIQFVYIPIPSFYVSLIGRWLHASTGIPYGIDYIDPWVHEFAGSDKLFSRHWFSTKLSKFLEPIAVRHASLITGVAEGYFSGVKERNPSLAKTCRFAAMPYGGEAQDHERLKELDIAPYLFRPDPAKLQMVYAGAMLPKAYAPLERIFQVISAGDPAFAKLELHFIGTGKRANDPESHNIRPLAEKYGLWQKSVFEYPKRIPYLDVLVHLDAADGVFILGSTEPHYTPSKVYQGVLSKKPILAVLHSASTAVEVIRTSKAGLVLDFEGEAGLERISEQFASLFREYLGFVQAFEPDKVDRSSFEKYSAQAVTAQLADQLNLLFNNQINHTHD